jgi:hypothetical protein
MTDNITLPRALVEEVRELIRTAVHSPYGSVFRNPYKHQQAVLAAIEAALAEPPAKPEPVAWMYVNLEGECEQIEYGTPSIDDDSITLLYAAPPAAKPEPATDEQVAEAYKASENDESYWLDYPDGWRAAERFHGITKEDKT